MSFIKNYVSYNEYLFTVIVRVCEREKEFKVTLRILATCKYFHDVFISKNIWTNKLLYQYPNDYFFPNWSQFENYYIKYICERPEGCMAVAVNFGVKQTVDFRLFEYDNIIETVINLPLFNNDLNTGCKSYELIKIKPNKRFLTVYSHNNVYGVGDTLEISSQNTMTIAEKKVEYYKNAECWGKYYGKAIIIDLNETIPFFLKKGFDLKKEEKVRDLINQNKFIYIQRNRQFLQKI
jgi:hypothetical protein